MEFADRLDEAMRRKRSMAVLGIDPQLDSKNSPGIPNGYTLTRLCCETVEACAQSVVAVKPQLAFFEARGVDGMRALAEVLATARRCGLITIADAKRGDVGPTAEAYAHAYLGDGDFACDAATANPYLGTDSIAPFLMHIRRGRGVFVIVKTSNPSSGEFQDLATVAGPLWEVVARRVHGWAGDFVGKSGLSSVGAVVGATYPEHARRARELMPQEFILAPGYGAQGAGAKEAVAAARSDGRGVIVNASRSVMYAYLKTSDVAPAEAAARAAEEMRLALNGELNRES
ncbi:MAG: orotidine-5'-phosphate decarboxylase [Candidatus Binataceae bacterium]